MVDRRAGKRMPPHGRADAAVVAAMSQAISEAADELTRTAVFVFRRTKQILAEPGGNRWRGCRRGGRFTACSAGCRPAVTRPGQRTRRSLAAVPRGRSGRWR